MMGIEVERSAEALDGLCLFLTSLVNDTEQTVGVSRGFGDSKVRPANLQGFVERSCIRLLTCLE
jgi:hypothetical protein